jgi:hypothetical protein
MQETPASGSFCIYGKVCSMKQESSGNMYAFCYLTEICKNLFHVNWLNNLCIIAKMKSIRAVWTRILARV